MQGMQAHIDVIVRRVKGLIASRADKLQFPRRSRGNLGLLSTSSIGSLAAYRERVHVSVSKDVHVQSGTKVGHETRPPRQVARLLVLRNVQPVYMRNRAVSLLPFPFPPLLVISES